MNSEKKKQDEIGIFINKLLNEIKKKKVKYKGGLKDNIIKISSIFNSNDLRKYKIAEIMYYYKNNETYTTNGDINYVENEYRKRYLEMKETKEKEEKENIKTYKGNERCPKPACKSNDLGVVALQTRSIDETISIYFVCKKCNHRWKYR